MPTQAASESALLTIAAIAAIIIIAFATYNNGSATGEAAGGARPQKCGNFVCNKGETASSCSTDCACGISGNGAKTWLGNNACCSGLYNSNGVCCPTGTVWNGNACVTQPSDSTPPVRSNGAPSGVLPAGTTTATITLSTNELATCRFSTTAGTSYDAMIRTFASSGQSHAADVVGLNNGQAYTYYVRCSDTASNKNSDDFMITFSVAAGCIDTTWTPDATSKCGSVTQTSNCGNTRTVQGGVTCQSGFMCTNNQCAQNPAQCGNGIAEGTEQCDTGSLRGACPAACSLSCTNNNCQSQPVCPAGYTCYYIDNQNPSASDNNAGTEASPFRTVSVAANRAQNNNIANVPTAIIVKPGTYRETVSFTSTGRDTTAPILLTAYTPGTAIISGSDIWTGWTQSASNSAWYVHNWPYDWGITPYPSGWAVTFDDYRRRSEMLFLNDVALKQVLTMGDLSAGEFYVDEAADTVYVYPFPGVNMATAKVEVSTRSLILNVGGKKSMTVRGMTFQHGNSRMGSPAVQFFQVSNILFEDNTILWCNWDGAGIGNSENVTTRRNKALHNGDTGLTYARDKNVLSEDDEGSYNGWRTRGTGPTWSEAGAKHVRLHNAIIRGFKAVGNEAIGLWLDFDHKNVTIENSQFTNNVRNGIFIEANQGPIIVRNNEFTGNNESGIFSTTSWNTVVENNIFRNNEDYQILLSGQTSRPISDWETNQQYTLTMDHWVIRGNKMTGSTASQKMIEVASHLPYPTNFTSNNNQFYNTATDKVFIAKGQTTNLAGWRTLTGQDLNSVWSP